MAALLDQKATDRAAQFVVAQAGLATAKDEYRDCLLRYIREARAAGWSWRRTGGGVGMTDTGVKRFWEKYRMMASRLGG